MKKNSVIRSSFWVLVLIACGKIFSFLRDLFISSEFGSTFQTDAYFAANTIPSLIFTAIISSYLVLLIPTYKRIQITESIEASNYFVSRIINIFLVISIPLSFLGFLFIENLIAIVAPGFDEETRTLSIQLGRILILSFPFSSITTILATISNANNKYFAPHIIPLFSSLFVIVGIVFFSQQYGIFAVAVAGVISFGFQLIIQILISRKHFVYSIKARFIDVHIKKMFWLIIPIFLGFSIDQLNLLVNSIICSNLDEGSLSSLNYAQRLQATINGTISAAIITVIYPLISKLFAENKIKELTKIMTQSLTGVFLLFVPIVSFLALYAEDLVAIVYYRGNFDDEALKQTSSVFIFYSFNVLIISIREILLRLYYIKDNTKIPFLTSFISLVINVVLSLILVNYLNVGGLALANIIATGISTLVLFALIKTKIQIDITLRKLKKMLFKLIIPFVLFYLFQFIVYNFITINHSLIYFVLLFLSTMVIYILILWTFKQKYVMLLMSFLKSKIKNE